MNYKTFLILNLSWWLFLSLLVGISKGSTVGMVIADMGIAATIFIMLTDDRDNSNLH